MKKQEQINQQHELPPGVIAKLSGVGKEYQVGDQTIVALQPVDLEIRSGELLLIIGPSGSGKTTLLSLLGCVIYPSYGKLWVKKPPFVTF